jgi:5-methylcytosine-specific restriction endonuclease McrA
MITTLPYIDINKLLINIKLNGKSGRKARRRYNILKRDDFRCVICKCADNLTIAHINPVHRSGNRRSGVGIFSFENSRTLCVECHLKEDEQTYEDMRLKKNRIYHD